VARSKKQRRRKAQAVVASPGKVPIGSAAAKELKPSPGPGPQEVVPPRGVAPEQLLRSMVPKRPDPPPAAPPTFDEKELKLVDPKSPMGLAAYYYANKRRKARIAAQEAEE
jgi:hypothetical protein